jgi:hypothetical protein
MEKLLEFSVKPTPESYYKILNSKKTQNQLGEAFTTWYSAVLLKHYNSPDWKNIIDESKESKESLIEKNKNYHIDVISKLVASPRLGLLYKAWGMFLATAELKYLQIAFEVAGNSRSSGSVKSIAIKLYQDAKEYYNENAYTALDASRILPECYIAFGEMEDKIFEKQKLIKELEKENLMRRYVSETEQKFPDPLEQAKKIADQLLEDSDLTPEEKEKKKKIKAASKLFDEIAGDVFNKVV